LKYQLDDKAPMSDKELALAYFDNRYGPEVVPYFRSVASGKVGYRESPLLRKVAAAFGEITEAMGIQQSNYAEQKAIEAEQPQRDFERISLFEKGKYEKTLATGAGFTAIGREVMLRSISAAQEHLDLMTPFARKSSPEAVATLEKNIEDMQNDLTFELGRYIPAKNIEAMSSIERLDTYYGMEAVIESDQRLTNDNRMELLNDLTPKIKVEEDKVAAEKKELPEEPPSLWQRIWGVDDEEVSALVPEPIVGPLATAPVAKAGVSSVPPDYFKQSAKPATVTTPAKPAVVTAPTEKAKAPVSSAVKVTATKTTAQKPVEVARDAVKQTTTEYGKYSPEIRAQVESEVPPTFSDKEIVSFITKEARSLASKAGENIDVAVETLGNMTIAAGKITNVAVAALGDVTIKASTWPIQLTKWYMKKTEEQKIKFLLGMEDRMVEAWKLDRAKELSKTK